MSNVSQTLAVQRSFLHVGCGQSSRQDTTRGFIAGNWREVRLDIDVNVKPDILGAMTQMDAVASSSMDGLFSSHNIEHLFAYEVPVALKEFRRVLKDDGFAVLTCPDLQSLCQLIVEDRLTDSAYMSDAGPITPLDVLYGHRASLAQGNHYMAHRCGFTRTALTGVLADAGFPQALVMQRVAPFFDLWALALNKPREDDELHVLIDQHFPSEQRGVIIVSM